MTQHSQIKADPLTIARLLQDEQEIGRAHV